MKYLLCTLEDIKEKQKISRNCVLVLGNDLFTIILLTIIPSVDEDDRKEMVYEKLYQEHFLDVNEVQYIDRKSTRLNSSHANISYAVFCLKKKKKYNTKY